MPYSIGVDLGGTKIAFVVSNEYLEPLQFAKRPTDPEKRVERIVEDIAVTVRELAENLSESLIGVGIVLPGLLDVERGIMIHSSNLGWRNVPLKELLERQLAWPCFVEHDVRGGAIAELYYGAGKNLSSFLYVSIGTGIAGTLIERGAIIRGCRGLAGEIGHTVVLPDGPLCRCGKRGCLEALSSGSAMERDIFYLTGECMSGETIMQKAENGQSPFLEVVESATSWLALSVANLVGIFDPEKVIFGGGVSEGGEFFLNFLEQAYQRYLLHPEGAPALSLGKFRGKASVMGAAALPFLKMGSLL